MEVSCGGFSCQERHQTVVPPGGSPVKTKWPSELRRDGKKEAKGEIMVSTESNKNTGDLLGSMQGEAKETGHSKDF